MTTHPLELLALIGSVLMPAWNLPLIIKIMRRRSSGDLSLSWLWGVWGCMLVMVPWAFVTKDIVLRTFSLVNFTIFSCVVFVVMKYRKGSDDAEVS